MSTTPALGELLLQLNRTPTREPAARALFGWLDHTLARSGVRGDRAERARSRLACKLVELSRSPRLAQIEDAESYARQMVRCALLDLFQEDRRHVGETSFDGEWGGSWDGERPRASCGARSVLQGFAEPGAAEEKRALEASVHACRERARGLLRRAFAEVLAGAASRYHAGLRATFDDLCAVALDQVLLRARLLDKGPVTGVAVTAAYKRHERMRKSLEEAIAALAGAGRLTRREAEQARGCLSLLLRPGPRKRGSGDREQHARSGKSACAPLRLEDKQRAPGRGPRGALRGAA